MEDPVHIEIFAQIDAINRRIDIHFGHDEEWHGTIDKQLAANTEITTQVRDILTSFRTMATVAKWVAVMAAAIAAVVSAWNAMFK